MMEFNKIIDRLVSSILFSLLMAFISFSFFTGKFPPSKSDAVRAYELMGKMMSGSKQLKQSAGELQASSPSMAQIAEFQRQQLKLTEATLELTQIFERIPFGPPNPEVAQKLTAIQGNLSAAEKDLKEVSLAIKNSLETKTH